MSSYWLVRAFKVDDAIGIFEIEGDNPYKDQDLSDDIINALDYQVGFDAWWFELITKTEFETYQAFGFPEYNTRLQK